MQIPRAKGLGGDDLSEALRVLSRKGAVIKNTSKMPDTGKRAGFVQGRFHGGEKGGIVRDVSFHMADGAARGFELPHGLLFPFAGFPARDENQFAAAFADAGPRETQAEITEAARDELAAVRGKGFPDSGPAEDDFAGVPRGEHEAEGGFVVVNIEGAHGEEVKTPFRAVPDDTAEDPGHELRLCIAEDNQIHGEVAHGAEAVVKIPKRAHAALAKFDKCAAVADEIQGKFLELSGQGVQHHVSAAALRRLHYLFREARAPRVHDKFRALFPDKGALSVIAGRGENPRPGPAADGHGRESHAARGGMDEHGLARFHVSELHESVPGRDVGHRESGRLLDAEGIGNAADHGSGQRDVRPEAAERGQSDPVAGMQSRDTAADCRDAAGAVASDGRHSAGIDAHGHHDVAEIEA